MKKPKRVTPTQMKALRALFPGPDHDPTFRPKNSLERLRKKGFVSGDKRKGWELTLLGRNVVEEFPRYTTKTTFVFTPPQRKPKEKG